MYKLNPLIWSGVKEKQTVFYYTIKTYCFYKFSLHVMGREPCRDPRSRLEGGLQSHYQWGIYY